MQITQKTISGKSFFAMILLFAIYGCQTTNNTVTPEQPVSTIKSEPVQADVGNAENAEVDLSQTATAESKAKEASATQKPSDLDKEHMEKFQKKFEYLLSGHGGERESVSADEKEQAEDATVEDRPFAALEKKLYGSWINIKETESYDFHDDGTVKIVVIDRRRDRSQSLKGRYKLVEEDRIRFDLRGGAFTNVIPSRHFKISISENEFALTDEPKGPDEPDGPTTRYKRVE